MHSEVKSLTWSAVATVTLSILATSSCATTLWLIGKTSDDGTAGTLRYALSNATDGDFIDFEVSGTITLTNGQLEVTNNVTIQAKTEVVTVDGNQSSRVFNIAPEKNVTICDLTIANGYTSSEGGGIYSAGNLTLTNCVLRDNWATMGGGGIYTEGNLDSKVTLSISGCTLNGNGTGITEEYHGGGAIVLAAVKHDYLGSGVSRTDRLTIENSLLAGNTAPYGGAINIEVMGGTGYMGWDEAFAEVTVINSTISNNLATAPDASYGGAISVSVNGDSIPSSMAFITVKNCTLSGNIVTNDSGFSIGGAFFGSVDDSCFLFTDIHNSTLYGNIADSADGVGICGAIALMNFGGIQGQVTLSNCTLNANHDTAGISGILNDGGTVKIENTILANDPSGTNLINGWMIGGGTITSYGCNICTDNGGGYLTAAGDIITTDPALGPLQDNGGPTWTCALMPESPAINSGLNAENLAATDQRGYPRIINGAADIGAYEYGFEGCFITNTHTSEGMTVLEWTSFPMWQSTIMYTTNLVSMPFTTLTNGMAYPVNSYTDTVHAVEKQCFYKVMIKP